MTESAVMVNAFYGFQTLPQDRTVGLGSQLTENVLKIAPNCSCNPASTTLNTRVSPQKEGGEKWESTSDSKRYRSDLVANT